MLVEFDKSFSKAVCKINNQQVLKRVEKAIINCETALDISEIKSLKKMIGYESFYRIRIGDYRIGIEIINEVITFITILHRKDIYNKFP